MKFTRTIIIMKNIILGVLATIMIYSFTTSVIKVSFAISSAVPAARGYVKVKNEGNNKFNIHISITDLAEVSKLQPPAKAYVVWMVSDQFVTRNLGKLNYSLNTRKTKLTTSFDVITTLKPAKIIITAEEDVNAERPGLQVILATNQF
jgi:hypothetical protein